MKIQNEFYLEELLHVMRGINIQIDQNARAIRFANHKHTVLSILTPWRRRQLNEELMADAQESVRVTTILSDAARKIMEAKGLDEDGNLISLHEMMVEVEED